MRDVDDRVLVALHRAAVVAQRPGIVVVSEDAGRVDQVTGSRARTHHALRRLVVAGRTVPVRRDLLVLRDETGLTDASVLELVDAIAVGDYLVSGGRALQIRDLTDQHFFTVTVLCANPVAGFSWRGEHVRFQRVAAERVWGGRPVTGIPGRPRPVVATPERAIVDSIANPRLGVTLGQVAAALRTGLTRDPRLASRLEAVARRYGVASVSRRLGLLVEQIAGPSVAEPFKDLIGPSPTAILLNAGGGQDGPLDSRWRVRVNTDLELLLETAATA